MTAKLSRFMCAFVVCVFASAIPAMAEVVIDITKGNADPVPIAIVDFDGAKPDEVGS